MSVLSCAHPERPPMSVLRRLVLNSPGHPQEVAHGPSTETRREPPVRRSSFDRNAEVWKRVQGILARRIDTMEKNVEEVTDAWGDLQGIDRHEWEARLRSYTFALEELRSLAAELAASRSEIP